MPQRIIGNSGGSGLSVTITASNDVLALLGGNAEPLRHRHLRPLVEPLAADLEQVLRTNPRWPVRTGRSIRSFYVDVTSSGRRLELVIRNAATAESGRPIAYARIVEQQRGQPARQAVLEYLSEQAAASGGGGPGGAFRAGRVLGLALRAGRSLLRSAPAEIEAIQQRLEDER